VPLVVSVGYPEESSLIFVFSSTFFLLRPCVNDELLYVFFFLRSFHYPHLNLHVNLDQ
jgi:hypothetical protein